MKKNFLLSALALWASGYWITAVHGEEAATVLENRVNVRGQPTLSSEVIAQLKEGDTVTILEELPPDKLKPGEPSKWARIAMPANINVWVHSRFIDEPSKTVLSRRLNARSGPGENFSIVGRLAQGDEISEVSRKDSWVEIRPPTNAYAFVAIELLKRTNLPSETVEAVAAVTPAVTAETTPATEPPPALKPPPEGVTPAPAPTTALTDSTPTPTTVLVEVPAIISTETTTVATPPPSSAPVEPAPTLVAESKPLIQVRDENPATITLAQVDGNQARTLPAQSAETSTSRSSAETLMAPSYGGTTKRIVRREGIISRTASVQAPTHYELESLENSRVINYLYPTTENLSLRGLVGKKVFVTGEEVVDKRWPSTPVLEVDTIELLP
jgi:hypothetical protein